LLLRDQIRRLQTTSKSHDLARRPGHSIMLSHRSIPCAQPISQYMSQSSKLPQHRQVLTESHVVTPRLCREKLTSEEARIQHSLYVSAGTVSAIRRNFGEVELQNVMHVQHLNTTILSCRTATHDGKWSIRSTSIATRRVCREQDGRVGYSTQTVLLWKKPSCAGTGYAGDVYVRGSGSSLAGTATGYSLFRTIIGRPWPHRKCAA